MKTKFAVESSCEQTVQREGRFSESNQLNLEMFFTQICFMSSEDLELHTTKRMDDGRAEARESLKYLYKLKQHLTKINYRHAV